MIGSQLFSELFVFAVEIGLILMAIYLAVSVPSLGDAFFRRVTRPLAALARRPAASLIVIGLAPLILRALLLPLERMPQPSAHDEFSYLLAADTFAHGRLVNPTHPLWQFFETFHVLQQPVYASMYPPAQGMFLAAGQLLTGIPWAGVWLSMGLFCAALLWMLRGWFSPGWAFLGASLAVIRIGVFSYWINSYWGGAVGALAGALVAGALPRLCRRPRPLDAIWMGLGFVILVNSRPYEGMFFGLAMGGALLWRSIRRRQFPLAIYGPLTAVLLLGAAFTLYYNWKVTGSPWTPGEQLEREQYAIQPILVFQKPRPEPVYRHPVMWDFYANWEAQDRYRPESAFDYLLFLKARAKVAFFFYLGPLLLLPLLCAPQVLVSRKLRVPALACLLVAVGISLEIWPMGPHYCSPLTAVIYAFVVASMRRLRHFTLRGKPAGLMLVRLIPAICLLMAAGRTLAEPFGVAVPGGAAWFDGVSAGHERAQILRQLQSESQKTLVMVRYLPGHHPGGEWVYNEADIDRAKVVWAREMDKGNDVLFNYFRDRQVMLVMPDPDPIPLAPYTPPGEKTK